MTQNDSYVVTQNIPIQPQRGEATTAQKAYCHNVERLAYDPALNMTLQSRHLVI